MPFAWSLPWPLPWPLESSSLIVISAQNACHVAGAEPARYALVMIVAQAFDNHSVAIVPRAKLFFA